MCHPFNSTCSQVNFLSVSLLLFVAHWHKASDFIEIPNLQNAFLVPDHTSSRNKCL